MQATCAHMCITIDARIAVCGADRALCPSCDGELRTDSNTDAIQRGSQFHRRRKWCQRRRHHRHRLPSSASVSTVTAPEAPLHLDHAYPNYQPAYPDAAQVNGEQGNVVLNVEITSSGKVRNIKVDQSSGFEDLDNAAIAGVLRWRFIPSPYGSRLDEQSRSPIGCRRPSSCRRRPWGSSDRPHESVSARGIGRLAAARYPCPNRQGGGTCVIRFLDVGRRAFLSQAC